MAKRLSQRALAKELGISKTRVQQLEKKPWWPREADGTPTRDVTKARAAIDANQNRSHGSGRTGPDTPLERTAAPPPPGTPPGAGGGTDDEGPRREAPPAEVLEVLGDVKANSFERAQAVLSAASWGLKEGIRTGLMRAQDYKDCVAALKECRTSAKEFLAHEQARGELVRRRTAAAAGAELARRLLLLTDRLEAALVTQVELWTTDDRWRELGTEERATQVRAYFGEKVRSLRELEAEELDGLVTGAAA